MWTLLVKVQLRFNAEVLLFSANSLSKFALPVPLMRHLICLTNCNQRALKKFTRGM